MKAFLASLAIAALVGCASKPEMTVHTQYIPVEVPCKAVEPSKPTLSYLPPYSDIFVATRALLGDREAMNGYVGELEAALRSCVK